MEKTAIISALREKFNILTDSLGALPEAQISQPLAPGKWSIGQHAMHLLLSTRPVTSGMALPKEVLAGKFGTEGAAPERSFEDLHAFYLQVLAGGVTAPPVFTPELISASQKQELITALQTAASELIEAALAWSEEELSAYVMPHPALGKLTIREMLMFTIFHTAHHTRT